MAAGSLGGCRCTDDSGGALLWRTLGNDAASWWDVRVLARSLLSSVGIPVRMDAVLGDRDGDDRGGACARLTGVLWPSIADDKYFVALIHVEGVFRLRVRQPETRRPYRTPGYPVVASLYILVAIAIVVILFAYRPSTT
jgi:hypothetical protein